MVPPPPAHLGDSSVVERVKTDFRAAPISPKLKALLAIAGKVQQDGKLVTPPTSKPRASRAPPTWRSTTPCSSPPLFRMYNRYVDGLGTTQPTDPAMYEQMGRHLAEEGYLVSSIREPIATA